MSVKATIGATPWNAKKTSAKTQILEQDLDLHEILVSKYCFKVCSGILGAFKYILFQGYKWLFTILKSNLELSLT